MLAFTAGVPPSRTRPGILPRLRGRLPRRRGAGAAPPGAVRGAVRGRGLGARPGLWAGRVPRPDARPGSGRAGRGPGRGDGGPLREKGHEVEHADALDVPRAAWTTAACPGPSPRRSSSTCRPPCSTTSCALLAAKLRPGRRGRAGDRQPPSALRAQGLLGRPDPPPSAVPRGDPGARALRRLPRGPRDVPRRQRATSTPTSTRAPTTRWSSPVEDASRGAPAGADVLPQRRGMDVGLRSPGAGQGLVPLAHAPTGRVVTPDGPRTPSPRPFDPGKRAEVGLDVIAPVVPGRYLLEPAVVEEGVRWLEPLPRVGGHGHRLPRRGWPPTRWPGPGPAARARPRRRARRSPGCSTACGWETHPLPETARAYEETWREQHPSWQLAAMGRRGCAPAGARPGAGRAPHQVRAVQPGALRGPAAIRGRIRGHRRGMPPPLDPLLEGTDSLAGYLTPGRLETAVLASVPGAPGLRARRAPGAPDSRAERGLRRGHRPGLFTLACARHPMTRLATPEQMYPYRWDERHRRDDPSPTPTACITGTCRGRPRQALMALSVCCLTGDPGPRVAALLAPLREVADEIVVAADSRAGQDDLDAYAAACDRLLRIEYQLYERHLAWLHAQCRGDWILRIDGDECSRRRWWRQLPELIRRRDVHQYVMPRRWLYPGRRALARRAALVARLPDPAGAQRRPAALSAAPTTPRGAGPPGSLPRGAAAAPRVPHCLDRAAGEQGPPLRRHRARPGGARRRDPRPPLLPARALRRARAGAAPRGRKPPRPPP